ncbi:MAG TPA: hypothetical protein VK400_04570 [Pyrinomonadaceae bacterium]|nr:hypothetical protein [Pyrinomonadaceae bacterium]
MADDEQYHVFLVDRVYDKDWNDGVKNSVRFKLQEFFKSVIAENKTQYNDVSVSWDGALGEIKKGEIIIYFRDNPDSGKAQTYNNGHLTSAGAAVKTPAGALAEVYYSGFKGDAEAGALGAIIAFHEAMHVKLEFPEKPIVKDIHTAGGGGAAAPKTTRSNIPNKTNKQLMSKGLPLDVPQYT